MAPWGTACRIYSFTIQTFKPMSYMIITIAQIILTCIYYILRTGENFNLSNYKELINANSKVAKVKLAVENALIFLTSQGIDISALNIPCKHQ